MGAPPPRLRPRRPHGGSEPVGHGDRFAHGPGPGTCYTTKNRNWTASVTPQPTRTRTAGQDMVDASTRCGPADRDRRGGRGPRAPTCSPPSPLSRGERWQPCVTGSRIATSTPATPSLPAPSGRTYPQLEAASTGSLPGQHQRVLTGACPPTRPPASRGHQPSPKAQERCRRRSRSRRGSGEDHEPWSCAGAADPQPPEQLAQPVINANGFSCTRGSADTASAVAA